MVSVQIGDRAMLVDSNTAKMIQRKIQQSKEKSRRLSRELKEAHILPNSSGSQFAGWVTTSASCSSPNELPQVVRAKVFTMPEYSVLDPRD
jgi:hypothetical protein